MLGGRSGFDILSGGRGRDTFLFNAVVDSPADRPDRVADFADDQDLIDVSAPGFTAFIGTATFSGAGQLQVTEADGGGTAIEGDVDGADVPIEVGNVTDLSIWYTISVPLIGTVEGRF